MKVRHTYGLYFSSFVHKIIRLRMLTQWPLLRRGTVVLLNLMKFGKGSGIILVVLKIQLRMFTYKLKPL